ncbi:MAG: hypothetical protein OEY97_01650 [Nitrospirota bacterium]|nr:hypothetical protein [Nitrospirota bacterium]
MVSLTVFGLSADIAGAIFLAKGLIISPKQAVELSRSRYDGDTDEEILGFPQVQDRLDQSMNAQFGAILLVSGYVLQIMGACL